MRPPVLRSAFVVAVLYVLLGLLQDGWFSPRTPIHLLNGGAVLGLAALGQTFVIATGGIDLAVGAWIACGSTAVAAALAAGVPLALVVPVLVALGVLLGAVSGLVIAVRQVPPFLVTLAMMLFLRGLAGTLHEGSLGITAADHAALRAVAIRFDTGLALGPSALAWILATWGGTFFLARMRTGREVLACGGDARAARLLGVPVVRRVVLAYALSGACAALGGVALTLDTSAGNPGAAVALELDAIAAVVIGGAALEGGLASPLGTAVGVVLLGMIQTAITFDGRLGSGWSKIAVGALILAYLLIQRVFRRLPP